MQWNNRAKRGLYFYFAEFAGSSEHNYGHTRVDKYSAVRCSLDLLVLLTAASSINWFPVLHPKWKLNSCDSGFVSLLSTDLDNSEDTTCHPASVNGAFRDSNFSFQRTDPLNYNRIMKSRSWRAEHLASGNVAEKEGAASDCETYTRLQTRLLQHKVVYSSHVTDGFALGIG